MLSIDALGRIASTIETMRPVFSAVAAAVEQQIASTNDLAGNAAAASQFISHVADGVTDIESTATTAAGHSQRIDASSREAVEFSEKLRTRFTIFLRQTEIGDRRQDDRLPCDLDITLRQGRQDARGEVTGKVASGKVVDLSAGGLLANVPEGQTIGDTLQATVAEIGSYRVRVVNRSALGLHLQFVDIADDMRATLSAKLAEIRQKHETFIQRATEAASKISAAFEHLVNSGALTRDALFDNIYVPIQGSNPTQFRTAFLDALDGVLPAIQEPLLASDSRMAFCAAIDRNGYLPVHNRIYAKPQKPDDPAWNMANCRNRRIFDDRAGLSAARNSRPYLIQNYPRDMGNGVIIRMSEVDAPIKVFGKHWGGFRTAYKG